MKKIFGWLDFNDFLIIIGLILLAYALSMVSLALSIGISGGILMAIGLLGAWRKAK